MVIEFLTFDVKPEEREEWLAVEEQTWSRFLERQAGFVSKQIWSEHDNRGQVHAVICWTDEASWHAIPADELEEVDKSMGRWFRACTMRVFDVERNS
jgi:uncharacterized protein (TIGR03792 family)